MTALANETAARDYGPLNIAQLFEAEAARRREAVALVFQEERVSYGDLNRRANRFAHYLRESGVRRETPVALCLERSVELIVALLGILKAGGAYVALDPTYPKERLALMLANADVPLLITAERLRDRLPDFGGRFILFQQESATFERQPEENLASSAGLDDLAYISYTSGSTGAPKGVAIPHRGVVRLVKAGGFARMDETETFLQMAPVGFDASTFEIWGALLNGGRLVIMPPQTPSLEELSSALRRHGVTTMWLTAGLFHLMVDERLEDLRGLRQLLAGGDVLSPAHVRKAFEALPDCQLINGYGPTENTTFTCCHRVTRGDLDGRPIPLGRTIGHTSVHILSERMEAVQVGEIGQLYIGGDGLARGYWREPELTAARFVQDPFSYSPAARLYKSGDLARWRDDGVVEFIGRADDQVKISGYRIELREIEAALRRHEGVRDAAVLATERGHAGKQIVTYFIPVGSPVPGACELRAFLRHTLPDYMLPVEFVAMESLPLTENGKVDRRALTKHSHTQPSPSAPPQSEMERSISAIWRDVIGHPHEIGVDDNFFDLGGNSLRIVEVHARLERTLQASLPLTALFQYPTVRSLAGFLAIKGASGTDIAAVTERALRQRAARAQRREARARV